MTEYATIANTEGTAPTAADIHDGDEVWFLGAGRGRTRVFVDEIHPARNHGSSDWIEFSGYRIRISDDMPLYHTRRTWTIRATTITAIR